MNEEMFEKTAATRLSRRTIVKTGTKLAYATPLVAASMKLGTRLGYAASPGTGGENDFCGHSVGPDGSPLNGDEGCMGACADACKGIGGDTNDNSDPCSQVCDQACPNQNGTVDRECYSDDACNSANFTCLDDGDVRLVAGGVTYESQKF